MTAKEIVEAERDVWRAIGAGIWIVKEFLLRNGQEYVGQKLPSRYKLGTPKMCYYNARKLVMRSKKLQYCEGIVLHRDLPVPIEHAWAVDSEGRVIDPTLSDWKTGESRGEGASYFGVLFGQTDLPPMFKYTGLLSDGCHYRIDLMCRRDPGLIDIIEKEDMCPSCLKYSRSLPN